MNARSVLATVAAVTGLLLTGCGSTPAPAAALSSTETKLAVHAAGMVHAVQPKGLETILEVDLGEFYFAAPDGQRNPVFRLPVGKTIGLHLHNEGAVVHELVIGRKPVTFVEKEASGQKVSVPDGYQNSLFRDLEVDVFFYYGDAKAELGGATFEELEIEPGLRDIWIRLKFPPEAKGEWELGCFVEGHYEAGMHVTLVVE